MYSWFLVPFLFCFRATQFKYYKENLPSCFLPASHSPAPSSVSHKGGQQEDRKGRSRLLQQINVNRLQGGWTEAPDVINLAFNHGKIDFHVPSSLDFHCTYKVTRTSIDLHVQAIYGGRVTSSVSCCFRLKLYGLTPWCLQGHTRCLLEFILQ